jgi:cob(I)alamin adenosyltransferase
MSPIYSGRGDDGTTSLGDGRRVSKAHVRVEAYGAVDEACSAVGVARSCSDDQMLRDLLRFVQQRLMNCGSRLAVPSGSRTAGVAGVSDGDVALLEGAIDFLDERSGPLDRFIVPGGCTLAAQLHFARSVVRRAERRVVALDPLEDADLEVARFLNRSSDLLFAIARYANQQCSRAETFWDREATTPGLESYHSD